jgi:hypothetical protein
MSYTDEHGRIVGAIEPGPLVQMVDFETFCDDIRFLSSVLGKPPVPPDQMRRWLDSKFKIVCHLSMQRWVEISDVATNSWRFWNEFTADWVQKACAEQARLEQAEPPNPQPGPYSNCPSWFVSWMEACQDAISSGEKLPKPEEIRQGMRDRHLDPDKSRPEQNQLILAQVLAQVMRGSHKPMNESKGLTREQAQAAKREVEHLWL